MMVKILVFLVVLIYVASSVLAAEPTSKDIREIKKLINSVKNQIKQLKNTIKNVKSQRAKYEARYISAEKKCDNSYNSGELSVANARKGIEAYISNFLKNNEPKAKRTVRKTVENIYKEREALAIKDKKGVEADDNTVKNASKTQTKNQRSSITSKRQAVQTSMTILKNKVNENIEKKKNSLLGIDEDLYLVTRQVQLQQFNEFEKARSDGNSGIKQIRTKKVGAKNYFSNDHNGGSFAGITDMEANRNKIGISHMVAVLNGFEFRTNDRSYSLKKPVTDDTTMNKVVHVQHPNVPDAVKQELDLGKQIEEMRVWFKAFQNQDENLRSFKSYFEPILTYLEGVWLKGAGSSQKQTYFSSYTGINSDRISYLPQSILEFNDAKKPLYSKWSYRFVCHELKNYLSPQLLSLIDDPVSEKRANINHEQYKCGASARFDIEGIEINGKRRVPERKMIYSYLDALMEEIPGKDNYGAIIEATGFDAKILSANPTKPGQSLNGANYHRPYKLASKDAMGVDTAQRSYCDRFYVALSKQESVSGPKYKDKQNIVSIKASYAVPVEIIYLTPLIKWNPYNIGIDESCDLVTGNGTKSNPYSAACPELHFLTPDSFFTGGDVNSCSDSNNIMYFQSPKSSSPVCLRASGIRVSLPQIHGINGRIRQRYPVMPVSGEGSSVWKKLNAIEDSVIDSGIIKKSTAIFNTGESTATFITVHKHKIALTVAERNGLLNGDIENLVKVTEPDNYHRHIITLNKVTKDGKTIIGITKCNSGTSMGNKVCFDGHHNIAIEVVC